MSKKEDIEEVEEYSRNALLTMFFIVITIVVGGLCFVGGIIYSTYLNKEEVEYIEKNNEKNTIKEDNNKEQELTEESIITKLKQKKEQILPLSLIDNSECKELITYDYSNTEDDYNYYLYTSLGLLNTCSNTIYTEIETKDEYKILDNNESFKITDDNYQDFSKYKITFTKGEKNNIYLSSIERIQ